MPTTRTPRKAWPGSAARSSPPTRSAEGRAMADTKILPAKKLAPLAPFAYDWVGGDIHGLAALAGTLYGYVPRIEDVISALDRKVSQIVGDAGWQGTAASAFTRNWEQISAETTA